MTDVNDSTEAIEQTEAKNRSSRRAMLGLTGAGIAGAVAMGPKMASAADDDPVLVGNSDNTTDDGATVITNTNSTVTTPGTGGQEAVKGVITGVGNGSHAILGVTEGKGHAVAGVIGAPDAPGDNVVGATWGRHYGQGAAIEGDSRTAAAELAGPANAVKGTIQSADNGSHAIKGETIGIGHAISGESFNTTADAKAATWGRHSGPAAATEGISIAETADIAGPANGVKGIVANPGNGSHAVLGITAGGGHAVAGDIEADAPNTVAATWGRHKGTGAGIGGISVGGYGGEFVGGLSQVRLIQTADAPVGAPTDGDHKLGELYVDGAGNIYVNKADGLNFSRLNDQPGTFQMWDEPQRAYDSRPSYEPATSEKGKIANNEVREIDLTEATDFPEGVTAAILNITVTETDITGETGGFLNVYSAAVDTTPNTSTINWFDNGQKVANGATVRVSADGKIKVYCRSTTHFLIDIVGYVV